MAHFAQGKYNLKNPGKYIGNRTPTYRSGWEFAFMRFCDEHPAISNWASEAVKIPYRNPLTGKQTIYVPDFFIVYADKGGQKRVEVIEVKPENQTIKEKLGRSRHNQASWIVNQAKWEAARAWCKQQGIVFRVVNEHDIFHTGRKR
jgi:TnsA endonuclease N terminal